MQSQQWHPIAGSSDSLHWSPRMLESGEQTRPYRVVERICSQRAPRKCWVFLLWAYQLEKQVWIDSENLSGETLREKSINKPNLANQKVSINITAPRKSKGCFGNTREFLSPTQSSLSYLRITWKVHYLLTWPDVELNTELFQVSHRNCHFLLGPFFPHLVPVSQIVFWPPESSILFCIPFVFKKRGLNLGPSSYWASTLPLR